MALPQPESEDLFEEDQEIIEIFVEEAEEVLEVITTHLPLWINDNSDENSLTEIRRAFHTLKGSGRMVKALQIAEIAWSVEKMLNHVINGSIKTSQSMYELINNVVQVMPSLIDVFKKRQTAALMGIDFELLIQQAEMLAKGETIEVITTTRSISDNEDDQAFDALPDRQSSVKMQETDNQQDFGIVSDRVDSLSAGIDDIMINLDRMTANMMKMETSTDNASKADNTSKTVLRQLTSQVSTSVKNIDELKSSIADVRRNVEHDITTINSSVSLLGKKMSKRVEAVCTELSHEIELSKTVVKEIQGSIIIWSLGSATIASIVVGAGMFFLLS